MLLYIHQNEFNHSQIILVNTRTGIYLNTVKTRPLNSFNICIILSNVLELNEIKYTSKTLDSVPLRNEIVLPNQLYNFTIIQLLYYI